MEIVSADPAISTPTTLRCIRCGYDLRTQPREGLCPECGMSVEQTMSVGTHLQRGRPGWLIRLCIGTWMVLLVPAGVVVAVPVCLSISDPFSSTVRGPLFVLLGSMPFAVALMHVTGIFLLTSREHRFESQLPGNAIRVALRISVFGSLIIAGFATGLISHLGNGSDEFWAYLTFFSFLLVIPTYVLMFVHFRTLAQRIGHASLAEHCVIVSIGICVGILLTMFSGYLGEANSIYPMLVTLTTDCLFGLWSTQLLFRLAVVLHQSARVAKRNWTASDAAIDR